MSLFVVKRKNSNKNECMNACKNRGNVRNARAAGAVNLDTRTRAHKTPSRSWIVVESSLSSRTLLIDGFKKKDG